MIVPFKEWRAKDRHRPCIAPFCTNDSSDRYNVPLCQEHTLAIWLMVDQDMREQGITADEVKRENRERVEARAAAVRPTTPGFIYYLELGEYLKIGFTNNLWRRMREYPPNATLLAYHHGDRDAEAALHAKFAAFRDAGREWYLDVPEIREHIATTETEDTPADLADLKKKRRSDPSGPRLRGKTSRNARRTV